ncbi:MAG: N-acetyltransferase family protein [Acutalibacteraceae bacterium]
MDIRVREAVPADAEALGAVHYRAWMETYTGLIDPVYLQSMSAEKSAAMFRKQSCREILAAEADGRVVGFCGYGAARDADAPANFGEIRGIYVLRGVPALRHREKPAGQRGGGAPGAGVSESVPLGAARK